jgi:hypothetical protein
LPRSALFGCKFREHAPRGAGKIVDLDNAVLVNIVWYVGLHAAVGGDDEEACVDEIVDEELLVTVARKHHDSALFRASVVDASLDCLLINLKRFSSPLL